MDIYNEITIEVDAFYCRNMRAPDFVLVGTREWTLIDQLFKETYPGCVARVHVNTAYGKIEVRLTDYYSMIAPVLEKMP